MAKAEPSRASGDNQWRWQADRNPYLQNIFTMLQLADPDAPSAAFDSKLIMLGSMFKYNRAPQIHGYQLVATDLAAAQDVAKDTNRLSEQRLLAHALHALDLKALEKFVNAFRGLDPGRAADLLPLPLANVAPIARRLPQAAALNASRAAAPDLAPLAPLLDPVAADERVLPR